MNYRKEIKDICAILDEGTFTTEILALISNLTEINSLDDSFFDELFFLVNTLEEWEFKVRIFNIPYSALEELYSIGNLQKYTITKNDVSYDSKISLESFDYVIKDLVEKFLAININILSLIKNDVRLGISYINSEIKRINNIYLIHLCTKLNRLAFDENILEGKSKDFLDLIDVISEIARDERILSLEFLYLSTLYLQSFVGYIQSRSTKEITFVEKALERTITSELENKLYVSLQNIIKNSSVHIFCNCNFCLIDKVALLLEAVLKTSEKKIKIIIDSINAFSSSEDDKDEIIKLAEKVLEFISSINKEKFSNDFYNLYEKISGEIATNNFDINYYEALLLIKDLEEREVIVLSDLIKIVLELSLIINPKNERIE
jgi:hypothetical protein